MSLLVDPDYIIHSLRLAYLRRIDDHNGPRVITFPSLSSDAKSGGVSSTISAASSSTSSIHPAPIHQPYGPDTHVSIAGLTDPKLYPEIESIYSPVPVGGSDATPFGGFASAAPKRSQDGALLAKTASSLRYTQTIYGPGRTGALGMRVSGKRASKRDSLAKSLDSLPQDAHGKPSDLEAVSPTRPPPISIVSSHDDAQTQVNSTQLSQTIQDPQQTLRNEWLAQPTNPPRLSPNHDHTSRSNNGFKSTDPDSSGHSPQTVPPSASHSAYAESSTESTTIHSSFGSPNSLNVGSIDLPTVSAAILGKSHSSPTTMVKEVDFSNQSPTTARSSPIRKQGAIGHHHIQQENNTGGLKVQPLHAIVSTDRQTTQIPKDNIPVSSSSVKVTNHSRSSMATIEAQNEYFTSLKASQAQVASRHARKPKVSVLSALLQKQDSSPENSFSAFYAGIAGRASTAPSIKVDIYFPWADSRQKPGSISPTSGAISVNPKNKSMKLNIRKDATMEEVIGYGLYCFIEQGWTPQLDTGSLSEDEQLTKLTTIGWTLMIVEDGEVDDDFPAIDRSLTLGKFGGDEFAICKATQTQIKQHKETYVDILRRASRVAASKAAVKKSASEPNSSSQTPNPVTPGAQQPGAATANPAATAAARLGVPNPHIHAGSLISVQGTPIFASGALSKSAMGPSSTSIFLRVLVTPNPEVRYKTTLQVPSDMYLADVLEMICRKRHLANVEEWALIVPDKSIVVPLDRTVESLQGNHDLALVRRSTLGAQGGALSSSSTNPNASIFKRFSTDPQQPKYSKALDIASAYKTFTVVRKTPMFVGRHNERTLTLDGDWLHIMPTDMKTFGKSASFHISSVVACKQSTKLATGFKLVFWRESQRDTKRYDFEAETPRIAAEIVQEISALKAQNS